MGIELSVFLKSYSFEEAEEIFQLLRELVILPEDPNLIPSAAPRPQGGLTIICNSNSRGIQYPFLISMGTRHTSSTHTYMQAKLTHLKYK